ncbi:hypothetical protein ARMGADRAFT_1081930 [Armillaria gallica]|uniref:Uncharacterized protein n=1 Tax=Armillaria gallica TaxID=47427 RepID=A0A2H3DBJ9_ARMGA|nr:hypothetical protein ARMGADRAFT_1081930 [Armillaria gallica]
MLGLVGQKHVANIQLPFKKEYKGPASQALMAITVATPPTPTLHPAVSCPDYLKTSLPFWFYYNGTGLPPAKLSQLLRTPSVAPFPPDGGAKTFIWRLETGLLFILNVIRDYLVDAERKIASCHGQCRQVLTEGTKAHFRPVSDSTLRTYAVTFSQLLIVPLRCFVRANIVESDNKAKLWERLSFGLSRECCDVLGLMWTHLAKADIEGQDQEHTLSLSRDLLGQHVHRYYALIVTGLINGKEKLSLLERILSLGMFNADGSACVANVLSFRCARIQRGLYSTQWHASFLGTYKATYHIPLHGDIYLRTVHVMEEPEDEDDTEDLDSEDDWEDVILEEEDEDEVDMDAEDGEDVIIPNLDVAMIGNLDFGTSYSEPASRNEAPNPKIGIIDFLRQNRMFVSPKPEKDTTCMSRLKHIWTQAKIVVDREQSRTEVHWSPDGDAMTLTWAHVQGKVVTLSFMKNAVHDIMASMCSTINSLPSFYRFSHFDLHSLSEESLDSDTLFDGAENVKYFEQFVTPILDNLKSRKDQGLHNTHGFLDRKALTQCFQLYDTILHSLIPALVMTCGITPTSMQISELQFRPSHGLKSNVKLIGRRVIIVDPLSKRMGRKEHQSVRALPHMLGSILVYYLGVLRVVEESLLPKTVDMNLLHRKYLVFVHPRVQSQCSSVFRSPEIDKMMRNGPMMLDVAVIRHIQKAFFKRYASAYLAPSRKRYGVSDLSILDRQSQHTQLVADNHYAPDEFTKQLGYPKHRVATMMQLSLFSQAFYELGPHPAAYPSCLAKGKHPIFAQQIARHMIVSRYLNAPEGNLAGNSKIIFDTLEQFSFPFLYMESATLAERDCSTAIDSTSQQMPAEVGEIGDGVLLAVASAYLYGECAPSMPRFMPEAGYAPKDLASAAQYVRQQSDAYLWLLKAPQILIALSEWHTGHFQELSPDALANVSVYVEEKFLSRFECYFFQEKYRASYKALCDAIQAYEPQAKVVNHQKQIKDGDITDITDMLEGSMVTVTIRHTT